MIRLILLLLLAVITSISIQLQTVSAQNVLTLEEAVQQGLENNYNIQISRNLLEQASNNRSLGNAGFFPVVGASASRVETMEDSDQEFADGSVQENRDARNTSTNAAVELNWTLFDGLRMFAGYNRLGVLEEISDEELRLSMENLITDIALQYFEIVRISEQVINLESNLEVSQERIEIEEAKVEIGSGSEYDLLQARSDLNEDRSARFRELNRLSEAKISLNELLARDPHTEYDVSRNISLNRFLSQEELYQKLMAENAELSLARLQKDITRYEIRELRGERYPEISFNSSYYYDRAENDGGFFRFNEARGLRVGLTARINIFDGFNTNRRVQNAHINRKNAELAYESDKLRLESQFLATFRTYQNSLELLDLEEENFVNAEETLDIALERFRLGSISSLEFREAQRTLLAAEDRLVSARFEAKVAETALLNLSGELELLFQ
ncbi:TolC family protein [Rhodohalobacter sp. SW132]|uniref:TolC family protein n=1 Tax=Rhodohalobacter sp. SW132 TaxID=2293433 RepID=UPI000E23BDC9|nr:TolC family protein [Rhodohalobacter sp. SW132]REL25017.1 TolC family protein [Rhodohalobacter sp. SW132]